MTRLWRFAWILGLGVTLMVARGQEKAPQDQEKKDPGLKQRPAKEAAQPQEEEPKEEDPNYTVKEYALNPLQAEKELRTGNFYFKKGSYKAARGRFEEAVKWNPAFAEAYLRLGEVDEKLKDQKAAREAYAKFLELEPESKQAPGIRKKLGPAK